MDDDADTSGLEIPSIDPDEAAYYGILVKGHLEPRWAEWFDGLTLTHNADGTSLIHGPVVDQAALHGVLERLRDLAVPLLSISQGREDEQWTG
jgi:hypothetical protein